MGANDVHGLDCSASAQDDESHSPSTLDANNAYSDTASFCHPHVSWHDAESVSSFRDQPPTTSHADALSSTEPDSRQIAPLPKRTRGTRLRKPRARQSIDFISCVGSSDESDYTTTIQSSKRKRAAAPKNKSLKAPRMSFDHTSSSGSSIAASSSSRDSSPSTASNGSSGTRNQKVIPTDIMRCCFPGCHHIIPDQKLSALSEHFSSHSVAARSTTIVRCSFDFCHHECVVNDMARHLMGHLPAQYECSQCGVAMARKDSRNRHLEKSCKAMAGVDATRRLEIIKAAESEPEWKL